MGGAGWGGVGCWVNEGVHVSHGVLVGLCTKPLGFKESIYITTLDGATRRIISEIVLRECVCACTQAKFYLAPVYFSFFSH